MKKITIAIDGYSSCGKSTVAKAVAKELNYIYIDSGAMYRAVTLYFLENDIPIIDLQRAADEGVLHHYIDTIKISFENNPENGNSEVCLNGKNVEKEIRTMKVSESVSSVSTVKEIRQKLVKLQQEFGKNKGVVMDGRDIGTVVFPDAELKIFMTADANERAKRRFKELSDKGITASLEEIKVNISHRDYDDTHRIESPLIQAKDAVLLDNTNLNQQQSLDFVLNSIKKILSN